MIFRLGVERTRWYTAAPCGSAMPPVVPGVAGIPVAVSGVTESVTLVTPDGMTAPERSACVFDTVSVTLEGRAGAGVPEELLLPDDGAGVDVGIDAGVTVTGTETEAVL